MPVATGHISVLFSTDGPVNERGKHVVCERFTHRQRKGERKETSPADMGPEDGLHPVASWLCCGCGKPVAVSLLVYAQWRR